MSDTGKRHILHIQKVTGIAGSENHLLTLLPRLQEYGYEPTMLVLTPPTPGADAFIAQMRALGVHTDLHPISADADPLLVVHLARYMRQYRFDVVHTHLFHADIYGTLAARLAGIRRIVSTKHGFNPWRVQPRYAWLDRMAARFQTHIISISQAIGQWLVQVEGLPPAKMRVIYYGLDVEPFRQCHQTPAVLATIPRPIIGTVTRLLHQKGVHVLLDAFATCLQHFPQASLLILGDGPERVTLEEQARTCGIAGHVHFLGRVPNPEESAMMRAFDIFAFPTFGEGFGLVLLEAMAWGTPIVASHVMAIPEIVHHEETGLLVPPDDPASLAQALLRLLQDPTLCHTLGTAGRGRVEHAFTVARMVQQTAGLYDEILNTAMRDRTITQGDVISPGSKPASKLRAV